MSQPDSKMQKTRKFMLKCLKQTKIECLLTQTVKELKESEHIIINQANYLITLTLELLVEYNISNTDLIKPSILSIIRWSVENSMNCRAGTDGTFTIIRRKSIRSLKKTWGLGDNPYSFHL